MKESRLQYLDLAGGILIIWIIIFHNLNNCSVFEADARVVLPFLTFSMPWFFYKSGMLFKKEGGIKKDARKLIVPFLKWSAIGYVVYLLMLWAGGDLSMQTAVTDAANTFYIYGYIPVDVPAWFMLSLFFVRVISRYLIKWNVSTALCIVAGIAFGYYFHLLNNPNLPFYLANIVMGIVFYLVGYRFARYESNRYLFALCAVGYLLFLICGPSIVGHHRNILLSGEYLLWPLFAYCGIITFNNLCRWVDSSLERSALREWRPLTFIGQNTMIILLTHAFVYVPIHKLSTLTPWQTAWLVFAGYVVLLTPILLYKRARSKRKAF